MSFSLPLKLSILYDTSIDFIVARKYAFAFSIIISLLSIVLLFSKGLNLGIDFAGGILVEFSYHGSSLQKKQLHTQDIGGTKEVSVISNANSSTIAELREKLTKNLLYHSFNLQEYSSADGKPSVMIRLQPKGDDHQAEIDDIKALLRSHFGGIANVDFKKIDYVGPKVVSNDVEKAIKALVFAIIVMMSYTWIRFDWQFGIGVMLALMHDAIATLGFYSITGYEFDLTSIAALLTIVGYSINDSVVIYDRIRENMKKLIGKPIAYIINVSINETLSRTVMTVATTLLVCIMLAIFAGKTLESFSVTMGFGIIFGTYSSIYVSAPILTIFSKKK